MSDRRERLIDAVSGGVVFAIAAAMWMAARAEPPPAYDPLGSGTAPLTIAAVLGLLAIVLIAKAALGMRIGQSQQSMIVGLEGEAQGDYVLRPGLAVFVMFATFAYAAALAAGLAFRWSTMLFLVGLGGAMCDRTPRQLTIVAVIAFLAGLGIDLLFTRLLLVQLP